MLLESVHEDRLAFNEVTKSFSINGFLSTDEDTMEAT